MVVQDYRQANNEAKYFFGKRLRKRPVKGLELVNSFSCNKYLLEMRNR